MADNPTSSGQTSKDTATSKASNPSSASPVSKANKVILSGVQPTGSIHLGNYLGAIKNWVSLQQEGEALFCVVDLHSLTTKEPKGNPQKDLLTETLTTTAAYLAAGIDPKKAAIFVQSQLPQHSELQWILACATPLGWLNRMTQFKEKAPKDKNEATLGLFAYPVLMAADILLYGATHVPVGDDQTQHLELTRDIAIAFNHHHQAELFTVPEAVKLGTATRVMSLRDGSSKMSKSEPSEASRINLTDDADQIAHKIKKAKTDPAPLPSEPEGLSQRPEAQNLVNIYASLSNVTPQKVLTEWGGKNFSAFKPALSELLVATICPLGAEIKRLLNDKPYLHKTLAEGKHTASKKAHKTLSHLKTKLGLLTE